MVGKSYLFTFGFEKVLQQEVPNEKKKKEFINFDDVNMEGDFEFRDYNNSSTIENVKEFFLTNFGQKYNYCKCSLATYYKAKNNYRILSINDFVKLSEYKYDKLYLIKKNIQCNCEYKNYLRFMNMKKFDILAKLRELDILNQNLKKSNEELNEKVKSLGKEDELKNVKEHKFENFYDIVIDINTIRSVSKEGWKVKFNEQGLKKYNKFKNEDLITIGVIGNNNKGKSFLLSKLSKINLLTGTSINTEGLSVKYPELKGYKGRQLILLDSAGLETPVLKKEKKEEEINVENIEQNEDIIENNNHENIEPKGNLKENQIEKEIRLYNEFRENASDKNITELFLENFIVKVSDILLIVVGKLTYSEQLLINKIKTEGKKQNKIRIVIVHNLQEFRSVEQVEKYIKDSLLKCSTFDLKKRTSISTKKDEEKNEKIEYNKAEDKKEGEIDEIKEENVQEEEKLDKIHFTEILNYGDNKKLDVYHLILANEDSEAGKKYNPYAYTFIENLYNIITEPKKFDIFEQVKDNFKVLSNTILTDNIENISFNENDDIIKKKLIKLNFDKELSLKRCYIDELGFSLFKTGNVELKYNFFKPNEKTLEIRIELPGSVKCEVTHKVIADGTIISVKGKKIKDKVPQKLTDNLFNIREFGDFELAIPLKTEDFKINQSKPNEGYPKFLNGVCCIQYELADKGETTSANVESDL